MSAVKQYTKLPVVISACQITWSTWNDLCEFMEGITFSGCYLDKEGNALPEGHTSETIGVNIGTLEGVTLGRQGDYVVKGVNGEFYPVKQEIFEKTFVEEA